VGFIAAETPMLTATEQLINVQVPLVRLWRRIRANKDVDAQALDPIAKLRASCFHTNLRGNMKAVGLNQPAEGNKATYVKGLGRASGLRGLGLRPRPDPYHELRPLFLALGLKVLWPRAAGGL